MQLAHAGRFREMAAAYPQVLISQRNLGQVRAEYVRAVVGFITNDWATVRAHHRL